MKSIIALVVGALLLTSCVSDKQVTEAVKKAIKEDPNLIADAIKAHPAEIMLALQDAAKNAREAMAKKKEQEEEEKLKDAVKNPLKPVIRADEAIRGTKGGAITLVEYSDFQCPYCIRGFEGVVKELLKKYKGKIQFVYKHLPLSFHQEARMASMYYEALRLQSKEKAFKFHDLLFTQQAQQKLRTGKEKFLKKLAKKAGANMSKLKKDVKSKDLAQRIRDDEAEARKFGIQGTPGFVLNGVPIRGAYPLAYFEKVLGMLKSAGKLKL